MPESWQMFRTRGLPVVLVLIGLSLLVIHKTDALPVAKLQMAVSDIMAPVLSAVTEPISNVTENFEGFTSYRELKSENIRLVEENEKLRQWYETALRLQAENKSFRELLNVKADPAMGFVSARVVSDTGGTFVKSVLLPVGTRDGVTKSSAVLGGNGLVGRVTEVGNRSARVLLVTDLNSRIPVMIQNTRTRAILAGKNKDVLVLERLPMDSSFEVGQRIVTSGDGGQLPADIPVGVISKISEEGIFVTPVFDVEKLSYVQIIQSTSDPSLLTGRITP